MTNKSKYSSLLELKFFFTCHILLTACVDITVGVHSVCQYSKQKGYQTADCSEKKLSEIPKNLRSEIEVLDLSYNYIGELPNDSFACCSSITFLYLQSNSIFEIGSHTFVSLTSLMVLDLSSNVLTELPQNLPNTLTRLYLNSNPTLFRISPTLVLPRFGLTSLTVLQLSSNKLNKFPKFNSSVPSLVELNITNNLFTEITADDLAPLCQLRYLHVSPDKLFSSTSKSDNELCECLKFERWVSTFGIEVRSFMCKNEKLTNPECNFEEKNTTMSTYQNCMAELSDRKLPYKVMVGSGIVVLLIGAIILLYVRRRQHLRKKLQNASANNNMTPANVKNPDQVMEEKCTNLGFEGRIPCQFQEGTKSACETAV